MNRIVISESDAKEIEKHSLELGELRDILEQKDFYLMVTDGKENKMKCSLYYKGNLIDSDKFYLSNLVMNAKDFVKKYTTI